MAGFPHSSEKFQVRVIVPPHSVPTSGPSTPRTIPPAAQLSVHARLVIAGTSSIHSTVTATGASASTGAVLSSTVIIWVLVMAGFPHSSEKFQVRVIVPPHSVPTSGPSTPSTIPPAAQLSVHARLVIAGTSSIHSTVTATGAAASTGAVLSSTVII